VASVDGETAALGAGASAFLPKPLQPLRLLSAVRDLLGDSAFARDLPRDPR
jgi:CheY-like chemotaxis protein